MWRSQHWPPARPRAPPPAPSSGGAGLTARFCATVSSTRCAHHSLRGAPGVCDVNVDVAGVGRDPEGPVTRVAGAAGGRLAWAEVDRGAASMNDSPMPELSPTWASLSEYPAPPWFRDAKFGIFVHWGLMSVPEQSCEVVPDVHAGGLVRGDAVWRAHRERYGHPSVFGFKDLVPLWKAERFDPDDLVRESRGSGARCRRPARAATQPGRPGADREQARAGRTLTRWSAFELS